MKKQFFVFFSAIFVSICLVGCGKTYSLNDYYEVKVTGYDGRGELRPSFEDFELAELIAEETDIPVEEQMALVFSIDEALDTKWSKSSELSNGDVVQITFNQEAIKKFNEEHKKYKLKVEDYSYTIEGLEEVEEVDFFEDIDVQVSGFSSSGNVEVSSVKYPDIIFSVIPQDGISNGDVLTIELPKKDEDYYLEKYGAIPSNFSTTYTVDGMDEYLSSFDQLTEDAKSLICGDVNDRINAYVAKNGKIVNNKHRIEKLILLTSKDEKKRKNKLFVIFSQSGNYQKYSKEDPRYFERYGYYEYDDIIVYSDGTVYVDILDPKTPDYSFGIGTGFEMNGISMSGYENYEKCYNDLVTGNLDKWKGEVLDIEPEQSTDDFDVVDAYLNYVNSSAEIKDNLNYFGNVGYSFIYIDEDDIPELVLGFYEEDDDGDDDAILTQEDNGIYDVTFLTYDGKEVKNLGDYNLFDYSIYYEPTGNSVIISGGDGEYVQSMNLEIKDGDFSLIDGCSIETNQTTYEPEYYILSSKNWQNDHEQVDENEFQKVSGLIDEKVENMEVIRDMEYYKTIEKAKKISCK